MARVVFHVGLPKTGTTTLQRGVFPAIEGIDYLGWKGFAGSDPRRRAAGRAIVRQLKFAPRDLLDGRAAPLALRARDWVARLSGPVLFSEEALTSNLGVTALGYDRIPIGPAAIRTLFPDASAILLLREPYDWLASHMLQRLADITVRRAPDGDLPAGPRLFVDRQLLLAEQGDVRSIFPTVARFDRTIEAYRAGFAPERLHLFAFERLFGPEEGWRTAFGRIFGVPLEMPTPALRNPSSDERRRAIARRFYDDEARIAGFVEEWRGVKAMLRDDPRVQDHVARHCLPAWRAAMAIDP